LSRFFLVNTNQTGFPTPDDQVNIVLQDFTARIQAILGSQFVGLYLYGSLALGDFDPQSSDIDLIVVTLSELSPELLPALRAMHREFDRSGSPWAGKVEAAYAPLEALRNPAPTARPFPQVEKGTQLFLAPPEAGWAFQRHTLREQGLIVSGPGPGTLTGPVDRAEMQRAAAAILGGWQAQARQDPDWLDWVRRRGPQSFVVLTICRLLYSLKTGSVVSKPAAARWAQKNSEPGRAALIQRALAGQQGEDEVSELELEATLGFLDEALIQAQAKRSS
jgi:hypothetical protein